MPIKLSEKGAERKLAQDMAAGRITAAQFKSGYGALTKATRGAGKTGVTAQELGYPSPARPARPASMTEAARSASTTARRPVASPMDGSIAATAAPTDRVSMLKKKRAMILQRMRQNRDKMKQMSPLYGGV